MREDLHWIGIPSRLSSRDRAFAVSPPQATFFSTDIDAAHPRCMFLIVQSSRVERGGSLSARFFRAQPTHFIGTNHYCDRRTAVSCMTAARGSVAGFAVTETSDINC